MKKTQINIKLTDEEKEILEENAKKNNQSLTQFIIDSGLKNGKEVALLEHISKIFETQNEILNSISELKTEQKEQRKLSLEIQNDQKKLLEMSDFFPKYVFSNNFILSKMFRFLIEKYDPNSEGYRKYIPKDEHKKYVDETYNLMHKEDQGLQ
ncbi:MAG: DUF1778 domain-containing protein [Halobacteriovoraceae bacterium]|nr:DUF1778 domain-containing protein [Halobacteriovoraceae bacterium]